MQKKISVTFRPDNVKESFSVTANNNGKHTIYTSISWHMNDGFSLSDLRKLATFLLNTADAIEADPDLNPSPISQLNQETKEL